MSRLGLVLSGGGARGAYEAGVVHYIRSGLPKTLLTRPFNIQTGTSVGAINAAGVAAYAHDPRLQGKKMRELWLTLEQSHIYERNFSATTHFLSSTLGGILRNFLTFNPFSIGNRGGKRFDSFLDTAPLKKMLEKIIPWKQLNENISKGPIDALAITATNLDNGQSELFLNKKAELPYQGHYLCHLGPLEAEHVFASAAIPILFPPVRIRDSFYADGGMRLFTPMSPAIQLGADQLIIVGLRKQHSAADQQNTQPNLFKNPSITNQMGRLLNGLFLDRIEYDIEQLNRINTIVESSEAIFGADYLERLNTGMKQLGYNTDIARRGLRKIPFVEIQPSEYLDRLFLDWFHRNKKGQFRFSTLEKTMVRLLDIDPNTGSDLLSYITFAPEYLRSVFDLGFEDAKHQREELIKIMEC